MVIPACDDNDDQIITLSETVRDDTPLGRCNLINEPFKNTQELNLRSPEKSKI